MASGQITQLATPVIQSSAQGLPQSAVLALNQDILARVQQVSADGLARLITALGALEVKTDGLLQVGNNVSLHLSQGANGLVLTITPRPDAPAQTAGATSTGGAPNPPTAFTVPFAPANSGSAWPSSAQSLVAGSADAAGANATIRVQTTAGTSAPQTAQPALTTPGTPLFSAIAQALSVQSGIAPLIANLSALINRPQGLPQSLSDKAAAVASAALQGDDGIGAVELAKAIAASGVFYDKRSANGLPPGSNTDLKAALLALKAALEGISGDGDATRGKPALEPVAYAAQAPVAPPRRGEAPAIHAPALPSLGENATTSETLRALLHETNGALARVTLSQIASLPHGTPQGASQAQPHALHVEIPVQFQGQTSTLSLRVERDDDQRAAQVQAPSSYWRVWFSLETKESGPVSGLVTMARGGQGDGKVGVTLWAERPETGRALRDNAAALRQELRRADLEVEEIDTRAGQPPRPKPGNGRFLDTST